jgi:hypothetical protein
VADCKPILLRPPTYLAEAMTACAEVAGVSRQEWMLGVLTQACIDRGIPLCSVLPDDEPLPGLEGHP